MGCSVHDQNERELAPEPQAISVADNPCPCCGCYAARHFRCGCGACDFDYCVNCGFILSAKPRELAPWDKPCTVGPVPHDHSDAEHAERISRWQRRVVAERRRAAKLPRA